MSYGLTIVGSSGQVQIENTRSCFIFVRSGVLAQTVAYATVRGLADRASGECLLIRPSSNSGKIGWTTNHLNITCSSGSMTYIVVKPASNVGASSNSYGLRVYSSAGVIAYDSGYNPPKPMGAYSIVYQGSNVNSWFSNVTATLPTPIFGRNRYIDFSFFTRVHGWSWNVRLGAIYTRAIWNSNSSINFGTEFINNGRSYNYLVTRTKPIYGFILEY